MTALDPGKGRRVPHRWRRRGGNRNLIVDKKECGCPRVRCIDEHSPQQIVEALGLTLEAGGLN